MFWALSTSTTCGRDSTLFTILSKEGVASCPSSSVAESSMPPSCSCTFSMRERKSSLSLKLLISAGVCFGATSSSRSSANAAVIEPGRATSERPRKTAQPAILKRDNTVILLSSNCGTIRAQYHMSEHILALADFGKHGFVGRILQAEAAANACIVPAQERVRRHFKRDA